MTLPPVRGSILRVPADWSNVYERLKQLCECETLNNPAFKATLAESVAIAGPLRDICKVGVYILFGFMKLTREEAFAIRYHMGPWREGEGQDASKAYDIFPLALPTRLADMQATHIDDLQAEN